MNSDFSMYTTDYISGTLSLRKPQEKSLKILENILNHITPCKNMDIKSALEEVKRLYPICTDFERDFMSLAFVLATGVGKTRLMGAFISYLYTNHGIKNFFVVAPGKVIYNKLKQDLGDPGNPKYVFKGLGCFNTPPRIIADDDYRNRSISSFESDVNIFVFNIGKFDSENTKMRAINEYLGDSFFNYLSKLDDLVLIMDESHHYHAAQGSLALNDLNPILGLELTDTPYYNKGSKQVPFRNAVYEYPLSESIKDGYTRTPYAVTREDINTYNFGYDKLDKLMLADGLLCHENMKEELLAYSENTGERLVKPFVMVVCKDTDHATKVYNYVISDAFLDGRYKNKTLIIHSKKRGSREADIDLLTSVEDFDNPIEILASVQQSIMNFGILMIQGLVNSFGLVVSAAFTIVVKIDAFAYFPAQDLSNAFSIFVSQNFGGKKYDRIKIGFRQALIISSVFCLIASIVVNIFAVELIGLFIDTSAHQAVVETGIQYLRIEGAFYIGIGILFLLYGIYRGLAKPAMSVVLTVISLGTRVVLAYILSAIPAIGVLGIWWAIPIGWFLADMTGLVYYKKKMLK